MNASSFPLIRTKLCHPARRTQLVPRLRLFGLLDDHPTVRLILVSAPAGFGKTTLVVDWLHHTGVPAAWYSLDERDNDFTRFLLYLIAAIQTQIAGFGQELFAGLLQPLPPNSQLVMDALLNELTNSPVEFVLVLDDYHLIDNVEIHQHLAALIDYLPPQIRLIIISRVAPNLPVARWRARGQVAEVTATELRFDTRETRDFLHTTMALALPDRDIADLAQRTEGWVAGLQLGALSARSAPDQAAAIQSFSGSERHVADFLISEVMNRQPASIRQFLEHTSILDQFNSSLCDYLLETDESRHQLEIVDRENLFLIALDNHREWYRYHHLFGELLRNRLTQMAPVDTIARLHRRAAAWYAEQGRTDDAIHHSLAGDDAPTAAQLVAGTPLEMLWQPGGVSMVRRWVNDLPEVALLAHPRSALMGAFAGILVGDIPTTTRYATLAEGIPELDAERNLIQAIFARNQGHMEKALDLLQIALQKLPSDQWLPRTIARLQIAIIYLESGELNRSATLLRDLQTDLDNSSQAGLTMMLQTAAFECMAASLRGDLEGAKRIGRDALATVQRSPHIVPIVGQIHATLAGIAYFQNDLDEAQEELDQSLYWGERTGITDILLNAYEIQTKLHCARGEREQALARLQRMRVLYANSKLPDLNNIGQAEEAAIHLRLGNLAQAMTWATESGHELADMTHPRFRSIYHILANVYLAVARTNRDRSRLDEILDLAERLSEQSAELGQIPPHISALLLQTQTLALQGKQIQARARLVQALTLAGPGKFIRIFLDSSPSLLELLHPLTAEQPSNAFLIAIVQAFEQDDRQNNPLVDPLTDREMEVLGLIAVGLSNKEIEERLVISHNTVRTHIKNLYGKLTVSSRTQAVRKGQELGLI